MRHLVLLLACVLIFGCATSYTKPIDQMSAPLKEQDAILLIGVTGNSAVDYIQLCADDLFTPCFNYRFEPVSNDVIALPAPTPVKRLNFSVYTTANRGGGYVVMPNFSAPVGYQSVDDEYTSIDRPGVFYYLTLNSDTREVVQQPDSLFIARAYEKYGAQLDGLPQLNFEF